MKVVKGKEYFVDDQSYKTCSIGDYVHTCCAHLSKGCPAARFRRVVSCAGPHASKLGEALRRELYDDAGHEAGRVAVWLISFVAKLQDDSKKGHDLLFNITTPLSQMIWNKYPNCCHTYYGHHIVLPETCVLHLNTLINCIGQELVLYLSMRIWIFLPHGG